MGVPAAPLAHCRQGPTAAPALVLQCWALFFQQFGFRTARTTCWGAMKGDFFKAANMAVCSVGYFATYLFIIPCLLNEKYKCLARIGWGIT